MIEIKSFDDDRRSGRSLELTARVLEVLSDRVAAEHAKGIFILSFDSRVLRHASQAGGAWKYVLNCDDPRANSTDANDAANHLYAYCASINRLDQDLVGQWHAAGKRVMTYSCNTPGDVSRAMDIGCDVIMTDRPAWIFEYLRSKSSE
jgi:glycerophosphoryl diester phosphodiesterase